MGTPANGNGGGQERIFGWNLKAFLMTFGIENNL